MARLVAVDYDPFASQSAQPRLTPVDYDPFAPTLRANASGSAGVEAPKSAWIDETMGQYTRDRAGIDRLHEEAKAAGVPLGRAVKWKRNQLERQDREGVLQPPTTAPLSLGDVDERNVSERAAAIRAAEMIQSSPLATWPNTGANTAIPGEADNNELTSALDVLENYRKKVAPEVPGPQFMRQMLPRATPQKVAPDPNGSWTAAGESMLQGIRQSVAGRAQALGEKNRYSGNYVPAIRGLLDAPANLLRTEGYEQGAEALGRMGELGAQMAPEPTGSVYDDPAGWLRYYGQQGVASSGQTLTGVAAGLVNPALGAAEFLSGAAGSEYGRARIEDNATPSEAGVRGLIAAGTEGIPEMVGGAAMLGRLPLMKLAQSTARGRAAIALPVEAGTELATEKANIEIERARGKYISPEEESKRLRDAGVIGSLMGGTIGAGTAVAEGGASGLLNIRETIRQANSAADISSPMAAAFTRAAQEKTARILGPDATPDAAAGAQIADDAFRAAGVGTVAAADMAEQDALSRDLDAATRDQFGSEAEIDRLLTGGINGEAQRPVQAQAQPGNGRTVPDGQDAGRAGAAIPGFSGGLPAGVRASYPGDSAESGSSVGFVGDGGIGSRNAPAPQQFTELANGTIFVPGDPVQLRQRAADAGFDVRGLAETRNGVTGVRFGTGARDQIIGLFGGADPASSVEQSQPSALPEAAAVIAPPALDAKRTYGDTVFDERAHDLLDFIALNGGLDRTALESEGIDPANWNSRAAKGKNDRFFGKPLFRKSGGMSLETLREKARDAGFRTDKDVLDLIGDSLGGRKTFTPAGSEYQTALADVARQEADAQARQQRVNALPPSVPETDADAYIASRETEFDAPADRDGTDIADIESTLASVADTSPQQRASVVSLGHDYTAKLIELKRARAAGALNPDQQEAYIDLLEQDRETGKVAGRPMVGIGNKTAYVDALMQGKLMPVQVFLDADNFKALNDKFGHDVGDDAIRLIADVVRAEFGDGNVFHRGGDEFLTQGMTQEEVDAKMARVQSVLANYAVDLPLSDGRTATLPGIGVSYGTGANEKAADDSLKQDKQRRKEAGLRFDRREGDGVGRVGSGADGARTDASGTDANPQDRTGPAAEGVGDVQPYARTESAVRAADPVAQGGSEPVRVRDNQRGSGEGSARDGVSAATRTSVATAPSNWLTGGRNVEAPRAAQQAGDNLTVDKFNAELTKAYDKRFAQRLARIAGIYATWRDVPKADRDAIAADGVDIRTVAGVVLNGKIILIPGNMKRGEGVGVTIHEVGVHFGMAGLPGFAELLRDFKAMRSRIPAVDRAFKSVPGDTPKNLIDEEAFAYFVEQNWNVKSPLMTRIKDAIARLLNRLGIPTSGITDALMRQALDGMIAKAREAADGATRGVVTVRDGKIVYARDLLGEAPSETAQLVAQWKAKVDAKLRGDGRAYVKPSEGPGDLFGGPAEETSDLFAKPQQRAQGTLFSRKRDNSTAAEDRALDSGDLEGAVRIRNRRIAEQREALGDVSNGVILKMDGRDSWAIVMPDVEGGGKWRMQMFDRRGFVGHRTRNSRDAALDEALQDKYTTRDDGALDEIQDSPEFVRGNFIAGEMMQLNAGKITSAEFDKRIADYDSSVKVVAKYSRTTQTGRIRKTVAELTNAADSMGSWRDWYDRHDQTLRDVFGDDAELFQKLLSATSQAASVPANIGLALKAYRQMFSGEPFVGYLPAVIKNLERVAENVALRGQKISEYGSANEGNADAIAVDRHIAMLFFGTKSPNRKQVAAAKNRIRAIAERLGWQPREVQAALWAYNQTLLGTAPENVKSYDKLIEASRARIDALRASIGRGEDRGAREVGGTDGRVGAPERDTETGRGEAGEVAVKYSRKADGGPESLRVVTAGDVVDGRTVREGVPSQSSIASSLDDYTILKGIREVPMDAFDKEYVDGIAESRIDKRTQDLADAISASKEITPLIVAYDADGAYIIEGGHRLDALIKIGAKSLPAMVVIDEANPPKQGPTDPRIAYSRKTPTQARAESAQKQADLGAQLVVSPGQSFVYVDQFTDDWRGQTRKMRERIQDKLLSVRDAQKDIEQIRGAIEDAANVYRRENLMHGRVGDQRDKLQDTHVKPLIEAMAEAKVSPALLEDYLEARHAKERNEKIAATKGGMPDGAAGMTTAQAEDFLQGRAAGHRSGATLDPVMTRQVSRLARKVYAVTAETRRRLLDSGQITQDTFDALENAYASYVPLRGKDGTEGGKGRGTGKGIDVRGKPIQRAAGRGEGNRAQNILAEVIADAERSIINAEKLRVGRTLARLVLENPNPDVWAIEPVKTELKVSEGTPEEIYEAVKNLDQEEGTIIVKVKGKPYRIVIEDRRMAEALKSMAVETVPEVIQYVAGLNRYFSAVLTRYNPSFVGVNMTRDLLFGMTGIWAEHGAAAAAKAAASYFPAMRAAWRDIQGKPPVNAMGRYAREFAEAGGKTYFGKLENVEDLSQRIGQEFKTFRQMAMPKALGGESSPIRALAKVARDSKMVQAIEAVNDTVENTLRLSVYAARREAGASIEQAAEYAKNISVNFNRRGSATSWLNALYLFFNAATQGAHRTLTLLKNPKVQGVLGGLAAIQAASAMFLMGLDDEDGEPLWDSISPWDKQRNLIFAIPIKRENGWGATVIKIPMPYGFNLFPYMGGRSVELARDLQEKPVGRAIADYTTDAVVGVAQAMSPIPFDDGWKAALPHWIRIFTVLSENKDDLGIPIRAGDQYDSFDKPRSASGRDDTPRPFKIAATAMNRLGGGDDYTPPYMKFALDWAPEDLAYLFKTFAGGLGSNVVKSGTLTEKLIAGVPVNFKDVPVLSSFVSNVDQRQATSSRYYDHKDDIEREVARQRDRAKETGEVGDNPMGIKIARNKSGSKIKRGEGYELEGASGSLFDTYKQAEKDISRIRDEMRAAFNDQSISYTERIRKIDELKSEREEVQRELNAAWREQRKKRTQ